MDNGKLRVLAPEIVELYYAITEPTRDKKVQQSIKKFYNFIRSALSDPMFVQCVYVLVTTKSASPCSGAIRLYSRRQLAMRVVGWNGQEKMGSCLNTDFQRERGGTTCYEVLNVEAIGG
ncbi:hypothetical protein WA1_49655 [Scytonema hofmannii PCC 7110]|uniref:Uncharacterized protein n=1 Tax=Scytonema hofmannii PCC 7110 TaxID=128403 RepID=A0A139WQU1_9CYAN|nr:hypothetical protein [Scytonema hofmannii]KYC34803.1 hypothetical protein WA1_49655 [Scytonema hofmannii PCC 7110]